MTINNGNNEAKNPRSSENTKVSAEETNSEKQVVIPTKMDAWKKNSKQALAYLREHPDMLTMDFLVANDLPIYVQNTTKDGSVVIFEIMNSYGKKQCFSIRATPIPFCLSKKYGTDVLKSSPDLAENLFKGHLTLVNPEKAEAKLNTPLAKAFMKKLTSSTISSSVREVEINNNGVNRTVSEKMQQIIDDVISNKYTNEEAILNIYEHWNLFSVSDFKYLYNSLNEPRYNSIIEAVREEHKREEKF